MKLKEIHKKVPKKKNRGFYLLGFIISLYFFILSITIIVHSFSLMGESLFNITKNDLDPLNALGIGWLLTLIMQSSGAAASGLMALSHAGVIGTGILIYMIIGTRIGTTITALVVSLLIPAKRRDFRHGFEIGLANLVFAFPIVIVMFLIEFFFSFFSNAGEYFSGINTSFSIGFIEVITIPVIEILGFVPLYLLGILGVLLLIISLRKMPDFMFELWGRDYVKKQMNKYMDKKTFSFFAGLLISILLASTTTTITLLIPLIVSRVMNLKKVIPYIIGTNLGGVIDILITGLVIGSSAIPAVFTYVSFSLIGLLWLLNTNLLFNITKSISKRTLHVSRKRAFYFLIGFILLSVILSFA